MTLDIKVERGKIWISGCDASDSACPGERRESNSRRIAGILAGLLSNHAYYSYGGLDGIRELEDAWEIQFMQAA